MKCFPLGLPRNKSSHDQGEGLAPSSKTIFGYRVRAMQWCVTELGIGGRCCCGSLDDGLSQMIFFASIIKSEAKTDGHAFPFSVPWVYQELLGNIIYHNALRLRQLTDLSIQ